MEEPLSTLTAEVRPSAAIRDYAAIGDGRTAALVGRDGSIDWLCLPDLDSPAVFAALLDSERGGMFSLRPTAPARTERRYVGHTNVVETTYHTTEGVARVTDALALPEGGLPPHRELARRIEGLVGRVEFEWHLEPRFGYGLRKTRIDRRGDLAIASSDAHALAVASWDAGDAIHQGNSLTARFALESGASALLVLAYAREEPLVFPSRDEVEHRLARTQAFWSEWAGARTCDGPWRDAVLRSALALKLLVFAPSGAIAAAATTSLPERVGGDRNYDYRFSWIRDAAFTMNAFLELGCGREATAFLSWLMHASQLTHPELRVLYRLDGRDEATERELALAGYRGSRPVRIGNGAAKQLQLDAYGDLLDAAWIYARRTRELDGDIAKRLAGIADHVCSVWRREDSGIWEVRDERRHFTEGKMKCAIALERACSLAESGFVRTDRVIRWREEAAKIRDFVETQCWSEQRRSYVRFAGADELDASVLLAGQNGYSSHGDERLSSTIDAVRRELADGPFVYRYTGQQDKEGAFFACSFWLVSALARVGRLDEAGALMDELVGETNDVGLLSEEIDPGSGEFLGNFPQGLSHLALINAAVAVGEAGA